MTYRELLKLYQEGKLDKAQTDEVEHAIEKQEAISEYLYEKEEIPGLEVLQGQEKEEVFVQGNGAESEEEQRFVKMIQKTIRRTFLKMGEGKHDELLEKGGVYAAMWEEYQKAAQWKVGGAA